MDGWMEWMDGMDGSIFHREWINVWVSSGYCSFQLSSNNK